MQRDVLTPALLMNQKQDNLFFENLSVSSVLISRSKSCSESLFGTSKREFGAHNTTLFDYTNLADTLAPFALCENLAQALLKIRHLCRVRRFRQRLGQHIIALFLEDCLGTYAADTLQPIALHWRCQGKMCSHRFCDNCISGGTRRCTYTDTHSHIHLNSSTLIA